MAVFIKKVNIPQKSDLINIDMTGSGTAQTYRVLKNVSGTTFEVVSMSDETISKFGTSTLYENSDLDIYCNTTWYSTLSNEAKLAIVDKTFTQDTWYRSNSGNPVYQGVLSTGTNYQISFGSNSVGNQLTRHVYALSVQDVIDYLEVTPDMTSANTTLTYTNLWRMFWNTSSEPSPASVIWMSSVGLDLSGYVMDLRSTNGLFNISPFSSPSPKARPAFQIDLSKIDYTFTDGRQPVELKPVSILQKSNNALSRVGMSYKVPIIYPVKSDIVNIDMTGSGTAQQYRVLKVNGSVAEVISLSDASASQRFGSNNTYQNSDLDTYLNATWYATLSNTAKQAIVDKVFRQDSWYSNNSGNPVYQGKFKGNLAYQVSLGSASYGNEITRHVYALSTQDVIDYLEVTPEMTTTDTTLTYDNVWTMFWNSTTTHDGYPWLRSAYASDIYYEDNVGGDYGNLNNSRTTIGCAVRPAFQIDLSKIDFTIE